MEETTKMGCLWSLIRVTTVDVEKTNMIDKWKNHMSELDNHNINNWIFTVVRINKVLDNFLLDKKKLNCKVVRKGDRVEPGDESTNGTSEIQMVKPVVESVELKFVG